MPNNNRGGTGWTTPVLLGAVIGPALQLQQPVLWDWPVYASLSGLAVVIGLGSAKFMEKNRWPAAAILMTAALLAFSLCGWRAAVFAAHRLDPALEGRDVDVIGMVAAVPQRNDGSLRFRLEVESATTGGVQVRLPRQLYLGWYAGAMPGARDIMEWYRQASDLRAGERWRMTVRLKAPHGASNPHGFDFELWLWEQGLQATGYVRAGPHDAPPRRIGDTWWHPVERARQTVRDAVFEHVADRKTAGLLAALIMGDQAAIDRADWDIFRATGVAHLMSISGLHITMFWRGRHSTRPWPVESCWRRRIRFSAAGACRRSARCGCSRPSVRCDCRAATGLGLKCGCWPARWW
jgi:competence protein ComEC